MSQIEKIEILLKKERKINEERVVDDETPKFDRISSHLSAFILSNTKRKINPLIILLDAINTNSVYYLDIDSLYVEEKTLG